MKKISEEMSLVHLDKWRSFTRKLRKTMQDNPSLPVVLSPEMSMKEDAIACSVAYVYNRKTGTFKEKIILIYNSKDHAIERYDAPDINPPF